MPGRKGNVKQGGEGGKSGDHKATSTDLLSRRGKLGHSRELSTIMKGVETGGGYLAMHSAFFKDGDTRVRLEAGNKFSYRHRGSKKGRTKGASTTDM